MDAWLNLLDLLDLLGAWPGARWLQGSGTAYLFVNGALEASSAYSAATNGGTRPICLGASAANAGAADSFFQGYIRAARITPGVCRYTRAFDPRLAAPPFPVR